MKHHSSLHLQCLYSIYCVSACCCKSAANIWGFDRVKLLQCLYLLYFPPSVNLLQSELLSEVGPAGVCGSLNFDFIELI